MTRASISSEGMANPSRTGAMAAYFMLTLVTIIWGGTFLVTRESLKLTYPFTFLALRFTFATILLTALFNRRLRGVTRAEVRQGIFIGAILFVSLAMQTLGAPLTTASEAGFLVGLSIPIVPLIGLPILRKLPSMQAISGIALSFAGLTMISMNGHTGHHPGTGEWLMVGAAITSALHIVVVSKYAPDSDATNLAIVQIATSAALSLLLLYVRHEPLRAPVPAVLLSATIMGLLATAFALVVMSRVQQTVSATRATLIYALEPVWAGGFGMLAGETLRASAWGGCGLIFAGMIVGSVRLRNSATNVKAQQTSGQNGGAFGSEQSVTEPIGS